MSARFDLNLESSTVMKNSILKVSSQVLNFAMVDPVL